MREILIHIVFEIQRTLFIGNTAEEVRLLIKSSVMRRDNGFNYFSDQIKQLLRLEDIKTLL